MKLPEINNRILQLVDFYANRNVKKFAEAISIPSQTINRLFHIDTRTGKYPTVTTEVLMAIVEMYVNVSIDWLITGKGEMLKKEHIQPQTLPMAVDFGNACVSIDKFSAVDQLIIQQSLPIYDMQMSTTAAALFGGQLQVKDVIYIPGLPRCDGAILMQGDQMAPELKSGSIVVYRKVKNLNNLFFGQIYLLAFSFNGDEHIVVKYVYKSDDKNCVKLVSANKDYPPLEIPSSSIVAMAEVKAWVRYNSWV